jgi:hypothetical protein
MKTSTLTAMTLALAVAGVASAQTAPPVTMQPIPNPPEKPHHMGHHMAAKHHKVAKHDAKPAAAK